MKSKIRISKSAKNKRNKRKQPSTIGSAGLEILKERVPASVDQTVVNPTSFRLAGKGKFSQDWGESERVVGSQQFCLVIPAGDSLSDGVFGNATGFTFSNSVFLVNPGAMNGRVGYLAAIFQRYAFRKLRWTYITRAGSNQLGSFVIAYTTDSGQSLASQAEVYDYGELQSFTPSWVIPYRKQSHTIQVEYEGSRTWYTTYNRNIKPNEATDVRQAVQGALYSAVDTTKGVAGVILGELYVEYVVDFYGPSDFNFNVPLDMMGFSSTSAELIKISKHLKKVTKEEQAEMLALLKLLLVNLLKL